MPSPNAKTASVVAVSLIASTAVLALVAALIYAAVIPLPDETRVIATAVIGVAAAADFFIAVWFFRKGQSS